MKKILLIEDDHSLNMSVMIRLQAEGYKVLSAFSLWEAETVVTSTKWDMILCDVNLPDGDGFAFYKKLDTKLYEYFIFLTALDSEEHMLQGYQLGADDYITKPFSTEVLLQKINAIFKRTKVAELTMIKNGPLTLNLELKQATLYDKKITLSASEWRLLLFFAEHQNQVLAKSQILEVFSVHDALFYDDNTVSVNIRRLREKIEKDPSNPVFIKNIRGLGYVMEHVEEIK